MTSMQRAIAAVAIVTMVAMSAAPLAAGGSGVVNINTADAEQLMLLPRVGPSVAARIIEFREQNGEFKATADLMLVRGIGEKTFELIKPHVTISGDSTLTEKVQVPRSQSADS